MLNVKNKILWLLVVFSSALNAAEFTGVELLEKGDPVWHSTNGVTWEKGTFLSMNSVPTCEVQDAVPDDKGGIYTRFVCSEGDVMSTSVNYLHIQDYEGGVVNYLTAFDPNAPDPTLAQMYGLLTRVENLLTTRDARSAFYTASSMMNDRVELLRRVRAIRQSLK